MGAGTPSDPPEIPEIEPEGIPVEPPETIPQPDKGRSTPTNPNRYRPFLYLNILHPARSIRASRQCVAPSPVSLNRDKERSSTIVPDARSWRPAFWLRK